MPRVPVQACLERVLNAAQVPVYCTLRTRKRCELSRCASPQPAIFFHCFIVSLFLTCTHLTDPSLQVCKTPS